MSSITDKDDEFSTSSILVGIVAILITPFTMAYQGLVFSYLWEWFVVTAFKLPSISVYHGFGLVLCIKFSFMWLENNKTIDLAVDKFESPAGKAAARIFVNLFGPTLWFFVGWIWKMMGLFQ